ncbi:MAG: aminotransferase class I/II-fold pyridoxal phosphate-dependent enzyme, partial [Clostridium sp.]|nr:aminotransferase class I/II-fold pyridoxal phosphate-dependent enzyme [Clostridium sp.]
MKNRQSLQEKLRAYGETDMYPFHMPGHKRNREWAERFSSPFSADITEIMGFDNLHRPEGILRDAMEDAAALYGAERTWFLVGGSTAGILAALSAAALPGEKILMASNCHRSAYHAAVLRDLMPVFVRPEISEEYGVSCAVRPEDVERILSENAAERGGPEGRIRAVFLTSPTYEGVISDIRRIAETAHRFGIPLIVDEAHGAHLAFIGMAGESAVACGADLVIQSVHKTLPALTQTALLHLCRGGEKYFSPEALTRWLRVFESSSPSYILMESIDSCLRYMGSAEGARAAKDYMSRLSALRASLEGLKHIRLFSAECADPSKLVLFPDRALGMTGKDLADLLRLRYHLETEMACRDYVIAMTSVMDTEDAFRWLEEALYELDREL